MDSLSGIIAIDKPGGMTSHDVVHKLRRVAGTRRIGHTGTLDPMATGLMLVCIGPATRVAQFLSGLDKVYTGVITLGAISSTYDAEGAITAQSRPLPADESTIREAMAAQLGERIQLAPPYSAVKVKGKKLYEYARNNEEVPQKPRPVRITRFELIEWDDAAIRFEARVGSGTYIRSMAHDLGLALGCGAYLSALRRTRVGGFDIRDAVPLDALLQEPAMLPFRLMNLAEGLGHMPKVTLAPSATQAHLHGQAFTTNEILEFDGILRPGQPVLVLDDQGRALSVVRPEPLRNPNPSLDGLGEDEPEVLGMTPLLFRPLRVLAQP